MESQLTTYITLICVSGVLNLFLTIYAFLRRSGIPGAGVFVAYTSAISLYCFGYALELAGSTIDEIKLWTVVEYAGMPFSAPLGLLLVMNYLGWKVPRAVAALLFVVPTITFCLIATNDYHHLFYRSLRLGEGPIPALVNIEIGEWYVVHGVYTFSCLLASVVLLIRRWREPKRTYRLQLFTLLCGQFIPMTTAFLYLIGVTPGGLDPVPIVICVTSALYIWALRAARLLTVVPIAKETIFESIGEGVLVLDPADRLIDFNRAASAMLPSLRSAMIGGPLDAAWTELGGTPFPVFGRAEGEAAELPLQVGGEERTYQARVSYVRRRNGELAGSLLMLIDVTELKRLQSNLERMAYYDGLTNIYNRTQFIIRSRNLLKRCEQREEPFSIVLFDIDHFKRINDTYGHETGDRMLKHIVAVCRERLTADTLFARYGGEEFVLAVPAADARAAAELAERLREALAAEPLTTDGGPVVPVTSSFGIAQAAPDAAETLESLLRAADGALYASKRGGRNRVSVADAAGVAPNAP